MRVAPDATVRDAMRSLEATHSGIALVTDADGRLSGTVTDGDVRRYALAGQSLDSPVTALLSTKDASVPRLPVVAPVGTPELELGARMRALELRQIPIIDAGGRVVDVVLASDLADPETPIEAVLMAGGFGKRLAPLTDDTPKPMLPIGEKPILEHIVHQLRGAGIRKVNVTTHYRSDLIKSHFGDGTGFGMAMSYVDETEPQGTAGALRNLKGGETPLFIMNADILTRVDINAMLQYHRAQKAEITVGVRRYEMNVPYGVVETEAGRIVQLAEKPKIDFMINAGLYLAEPASLELIPSEGRFDMTDLIRRMLAEGRVVASFPVYEEWIDVGRPADYAKAQAEFGRREGA